MKDETDETDERNTRNNSTIPLSPPKSNVGTEMRGSKGGDHPSNGSPGEAIAFKLLVDGRAVPTSTFESSPPSKPKVKVYDRMLYA